MTKKIVTQKIANYACQDYQNHRKEGLSAKDSLEKVQSDIREVFEVNVKIGTLRNFTEPLQIYREYTRRYIQSKKGIESRRKAHETYMRKSKKPINENYSTILDAIRTDEEVTLDTLWDRVGGDINQVLSRLRAYAGNNVLIVRKKGKEKYYRLNPSSSLIAVLGDSFEKREEEMDRKFRIT